MSTYNFTVRATDDKGAYADRAFSMDVNDATVSVQYDRLVAVSQTGLHRSVDGTAWTTDTALADYRGVTFGNNTWVIWNAVGYRFSVGTGMTFGTLNSTSPFPTPTSPTGYQSYTRLEQIKYLNGIWHAIVFWGRSDNGSSLWATYTSNNLTNWTYVSNITVQTIQPSTTTHQSQSFNYVGATDTYYVILGNQLFSRKSNVTSWSLAYNMGYSFSATQSYNGNGSSGSFVYVNGFYAISNSGAGSYYTSVDGTNWVQRTTSAYPYYMLYQNGRLLGYPLFWSGGSTTNSINVTQSLNAGKTNSNRLSTTVPQSHGPQIPVGRDLFATYAGATYLIAGGASDAGQVPGIFRTTDDFATVPTRVLPQATLGAGTTIYAIAARDS